MYQPQQPPQQAATAVLYTAAGQPVTLTMPSRLYELYKGQQAVTAGVILLITGVLSVVFNGIGISLHEVFAFVGHGIWCGVLFIIAGAFGIASARKNRCMVIAFMVLAIIAASVASVMFILSIFGAIIGVPRYGYYGSSYRIGLMNVLMAIMSVIAAACAIWGSVLGCKVTCCAKEMTGMVLGSGQPVVIFHQQPYATVPQIDPMRTGNIAVGPPAYTTSVVSPVAPQPTGYNSAPLYNPGFAAAAPPPSVFDGRDVMPATKI